MGTKKKDVYLTFDDGPTEGVTSWVLDQLDNYNIKATFFCIGRNVEKNMDIYRKIQDKGHATGNHTYSHLNGLKSDNRQYFEDIELAKKLIHSGVFRPPYGMIKRSQGKKLVKDFRVVMWDVLSCDFLKSITPQQCLHNVVSKVRNGSVIVFHDSEKAKKNLQYALPKSIETLLEKGYTFKTITK